MPRSPPPHLYEGGRAGKREQVKESEGLAHQQGSPSADQVAAASWVAGLPADWMVSERAQSTSATPAPLRTSHLLIV